VRLEAEGLEIYLAREVVERLEPDVERIEVLLPGYGRFWLCVRP
jgi:hypothetical protein